MRKANSKSLMLVTACSPNPCQNGADCIADDRGHKYICNCTKGFTGINCKRAGCILFDFEDGLTGWTRTGTAFNNQPTYGDNSLVRNSSQTANLKGDWYIGTYENRPSPSHPAGAKQGNRPTGTMTSHKFVIQAPSLTFLIGGGSNSSYEWVELQIGVALVAKASSLDDTNSMKPKTFDVTRYLGQVAQLRIVDVGTKEWGYINVDHFHICTN
ncbi:uncharacterized protein LOC116289364 [Actinia tenebrosa]|uniref:Uncharacterized protein LOC116289364 n=1 Tax=Actinia tenebrosa TaxID=6105 RepID=A0A6P8HAE6_ACTTE|nr:uncharacterized protein LOC116289364 [Actinia tenebrosa]